MYKRIFTVSACLFSALILSVSTVYANFNKPLPPVEVDLSFEQPVVSLGSTSRLIFKVTPKVDMPAASVVFELPAEVYLLSGETTWSGAIGNGETKEFAVLVMVAEEGEYSVFASVSTEAFGRRAHLNIIASREEVFVSSDPFILMKINREKTTEGKAGFQRLETVEVPPSESETEFPRDKALDAIIDDMIEKKKKMDGSGSLKSVTEPTVQAAASSFTVTGSATYKDSGGTSHPVRYAKVEVFKSDNTLLATGLTLSDGTYSVSITATSGDTIYVDVNAEITGDLVAQVGDTSTTVYFMRSSNKTVPGSGSTISVGELTSGTVTSGSTTDSTTGRVFSVLDSMLQFATEAYVLRGSQLLPEVPVLFPVAGSVSFYSPGSVTLNILRADALDWDVLGHEFAHFLGDKGASTTFDNSPGGAHSGGTTIPAHGKSDGVRLAWSEGWATYNSIVSQTEPGTNPFGVTLPAIPNAGDSVYNDTEDSTITDNLETIGDGAITGNGQGYASENSIMAVLYDLVDSAQDVSSDSGAEDVINTTPQVVWDALNTGNYDDVGKFFNYVVDLLGSDPASLLAVSEVFAMNNVAPELTLPADEDIVSSGVSPTFTWKDNGDPTSGFELNKFIIAISNDDFQSVIISKEGITDTQYTFSDADWQTVVQAGDAGMAFKWIVLGYNDAAPRIPPATAGLGNFISNAHTFTIRAYHLQLTWPTLGADVDLHLRPPDGASYSGWDYSNDCAYYNRTPDWGVFGDSTDDPSLDRDCITSCTEENITIDAVTDVGTYKAIVHYYSDHGLGSTVATLKIFEYGNLVFDSSNTLFNSTGNPDDGTVWTAFSITVSADGDLVVTPMNDVTVGGSSGSARTKKKK